MSAFKINDYKSNETFSVAKDNCIMSLDLWLAICDLIFSLGYCYTSFYHTAKKKTVLKKEILMTNWVEIWILYYVKLFLDYCI